MLELYNTLTRQKELFRPLNPPKVGLYTCGPTVYGPGHIGHARSYIAFDLLKRVLKFNGFTVKHVLNITDVHDDMIKEANRRGITILELADEYIPQFHQDLKELNVEPASVYPRVTEVIPEIIEMIKTLVDKGYAYVADDGAVYYQVARFKGYGRLSGIKLEEALTGERVETDKYEREAPSDFALWKAVKDSVEERTGAVWDSPWGRGRPGWHIECSVMAKKFLGETLDIHAGAMDLKFPHHENEIAQSEAANGAKFVNYWVHAGLLDVENQKMGKSLGNIFTLEDLKDRGFTPSAFRYLTLMTHYRSRLNFTWEGLEAAQTALRKLRKFAREISATGPAAASSRPTASPPSAAAGARRDALRPRHPSPGGTSPAQLEKWGQEFHNAVNDDLNMPQALAVVWDLVKTVRSNDVVANFSSRSALNLLQELDEVLGLELTSAPAEIIPQVVRELVEEREKLRQQGHFDESDRLRQKILDQGYTVEDTPEGPKVGKI